MIREYLEKHHYISTKNRVDDEDYGVFDITFISEHAANQFQTWFLKHFGPDDDRFEPK